MLTKLLNLLFALVVISQSALAQLPSIKPSYTPPKYHVWGPKPIEATDGPTDPWTFYDFKCDGPSFESISASSTLAGEGKKNYLISNICDDDPTTAWVEGKADYGIGEFFEIKDFYINGGDISILNGYQSSKTTWENNSRVKKLKVTQNGKDICMLELADVMGVQTFPFRESWNEGKFRFTIVEVYPGLKYKDTAITGIFSCFTN